MRNMSKRKYAVIVSLLLTIFCCGLMSYAAADDGPPVFMEVSSIYGEIGKMGAHVPLSVRLYGQTEEAFTGEVTVRTLENEAEEGEGIYEYVYPVEISVAETKEMKLYVPLGQRSSELQVILTDAAGDEIAAKTMTFDISRDMGRLLIGALTDREEEIRYLDGVGINYGMVKSEMVHFDENSFPDDERGLELLNVLVINHYETDRLSESQMAAIKTWLENGGTLLIGTGAMVYSTLGTLADDFVEFPIGAVYYGNINMGAEYAEKAPGDSDINMVCVDLSIPSGVVVEESDGIPLLTMVKHGKGQVGIYSYDLGEITDFAEKNPVYVNKMLTDVLGEERISELYYYSSYGTDQGYWNAYSLVNAGSGDRLPDLRMYTVVILVYILMAGPGFYFFLKKKDMSRFYGTAVVISAVGISAVVYLMGVGTRFTSQFFTIASILEMDNNTVNETSYLNVRTPDSRPFSITVPAEYSVVPLTRTSRYHEQPVLEFDKKKEESVRLHFGENGTVLSARKSRAFEPRFFKVMKKDGVASNGQIRGSIRYFDGKFSGTIVNDMPFMLEDAALVLYGQMYLLGDMEPGEVRKFEDEEFLVWPVGMSYMAAEKIIGSKAETGEDREYPGNIGKSNLYSYYIGDKFYNYTPEARLVAIGSSGGISSEKALAEQASDGRVLYSADLSVLAGERGMVYRSGLMNKPEVNSGNGTFYGDGLTMYGTDPITVEYLLGTDIEVEKISLLPVSDEFLKDSDYYYLKRFDGEVSFYNYTTKSYDRMDSSKTDFSIEEIRPYLSQENHIVIKYVVRESDSAGISSLLPHLMVTGRGN